MNGAAIEVTGLTVRYGDVLAIEELSFSASAGEIVALLGPNGAGKTTTVETLEGYRRPTKGKVRVWGLDPIDDHAELTRHIGVMLQEGGVYSSIRPLEVIRLFAAYYDNPEDPEALVERVGLGDRLSVPWRHLSGGERQRLSLALALVGRPEVVFLDEPTAGIDPVGRQLIRKEVSELRDRGTCVLLTTHDLDEAEKLADRVLIIDRGRLLASGPPQELMSAIINDDIQFTAREGLDTKAMARALGVSVEERSPGTYRVAAAPEPRLVAALTSWLAQHNVALGDLRAARQSLEEVFIRLTTEASKDNPVHEIRPERPRRRSVRPRRKRT
ncbi:MAG: ABC transporter ATP-binding protein [Acidimicrobiales bacterium]|nr:ABC transporter ATP-binding protein [Acidimicrobiales bacterium]